MERGVVKREKAGRCIIKQSCKIGVTVVPSVQSCQAPGLCLVLQHPTSEKTGSGSG